MSMLFCLFEPARAVDVKRVVLEALDLRRDNVLGEVVVDRDRGGVVERDLFNLWNSSARLA